MTSECIERNERTPPEGELLDYNMIINEEQLEPVHILQASSDPDTMYYHEAMAEPDREQFKKAMRSEWHDQHKNGNFSIIAKEDVPPDATVLPAVWALKRKRCIRTRRIKKYKARLNVDGSKMIYGQHYNQTYAPVAAWSTVRLILTLALTLNWHTTQLDYVQAYPQAPVERELYMQIPVGINLKEGNRKTHVLQLHKNVYGQKQAGKVWYDYLVNKLVNEVKFTQSKIDPCLFYRGKTLYTLYTDDSIIAGPDKQEIAQIIQDIKLAGLNMTEEGDVADFLGVNIAKKHDGTIHLTQPHLIDQILTDLKMTSPLLEPKDTPAMTSRTLHRHDSSPPHDGSFHYRSVLGRLGYLETGSRIDIAYICHQLARFSINPKREHSSAMRWVARYLKGTRDKGLVLSPQHEKGLEVHVDADFSGNWSQEDSFDPDTARSRHGFIISYAGCPVIWKSRLQTEITLSTTEAEYTGLSYALREAIPLIRLLKEMQSKRINITNKKCKIKCRVYEDNAGAIELAKNSKYRPRTKHLNIKLHHFRSHVGKDIEIVKVDGKEQIADILTKPVPNPLFAKLRELLMHW